MNNKISVIIVAAGSGSRFGSDLPKQFCKIHGRPVAQYAIENIAAALAPADVEFIIALRPDMAPLWRQLWPDSPARIVAGGDTRWQSVRNALQQVSPQSRFTLVHDAARPVVSTALVRGVVGALADGAAGAIPVVQATNSLRRVDPATGQSVAVPRAQYCEVQTPQGFPTQALLEAYHLPFRPDYTDDASVMEAAGHQMTLIPGDVENIKITYPRDLDIAALSLQKPVAGK